MLVFVSGLSQNTIDLSIPPSVFVSAEHPNQTTMATMDTLVSASDGRLHSRHKQSADSCSLVGKSALIAGEGEGGGPHVLQMIVPLRALTYGSCSGSCTAGTLRPAQGRSASRQGRHLSWAPFWVK